MPRSSRNAQATSRVALQSGPILVLLLVLTPVRGAVPQASAPAAALDDPGTAAEIDRAEYLASEAEAALESIAALHELHLAPLTEALRTKANADSDQATRLALALMREGRGVGIDPRLLLSILLVENPWLDPHALSPVGAVGLMQVMPFHAGQWGCPGSDLTHAEDNICHGARIMAAALERSRGDLDVALLRYNGCVRGTNTPDCHSYPQWVYERAGSEWAADFTYGGVAQ